MPVGTVDLEPAPDHAQQQHRIEPMGEPYETVMPFDHDSERSHRAAILASNGPDQMNNSAVLISGAGPTGLALALWLTRLGIRVRIIDRSTGPGLTSRALAVQVRTLEFYRQLGIADSVIDS